MLAGVGLSPILGLLWEARGRNLHPVRQVCDLGMVLLERLRSDSLLVTHKTDFSQQKWDFARENAASRYVSIFVGETQQSQRSK